MGRFLLPAALCCAVAACQPQRAEKEELGELRREVSELRGELRDLREELRGLRGDQRELRRDLDEVRRATPEVAAGEEALGEPIGADEGAGEGGDEGEAAEPAAESSGPARQEPVKIAIESNPKAATVFVEGRRVGTTPMIIQSPPGTVELQIRVEKPGFRPRLLSVRPEEDTKLSVQLAKQ